ncbi:MAG: lysine biosynthesis protein LysX [Solirubrobacteraceae bacterium]
MTVRGGGPSDRPLAVLITRARIEERMLLDALQARAIAFEVIDERTLINPLQSPPPTRYRAVLNRIMSHTRSVYAARLFEATGHRVINSSRVIETCGDKILTSLALVRAGLPTPRTVVAVTPDAALTAIEAVGYPVVVKPPIGSWGRLLSKVNDRDAAETLIEHKQAMRSPVQSVFYIQEYIEKPDRDIRVIVLGERALAAVYRRSEHWITNTARGATTQPCVLTPDVADLALRAAAAVGGGMLAVDLIERPTGELLVTEVNHTMEFHGLASVARIDVAGHIIDYAQEFLSL